MELHSSSNNHHHKERTRKSSKVNNPVPEVKIQIEKDVNSSRTSSSRNHRGDLSGNLHLTLLAVANQQYNVHFLIADGNLTENSCSENPWSRDTKQHKIYHSSKTPRKGITS